MIRGLTDVEITPSAAGIELTVKVVPGASQTKVVGAWGTALKVAVSAPPEGGRANVAVVKLLAAAFDVPKTRVTILRGHTQAVKRVAVAGLTPQQALQRLTESV